MSSSDERVVLVTGCSTGIGRALALEFRARGHRTFATARKVEAIADLEAEGIEALRLDVGDVGQIREAVGTVLARAGRIDVLVNNAGVNAFGPILELPLERLLAVLSTNVVGLLAVCQAVFPAMARARSGLIVNIGSVVGLLPTPFAAGYCASKSAVHMLSEVMRMEVRPFGIDVIVVQPGGVKSSITDSAAGDIERYGDPSSLYHRAYEGIRKRAYASQDNPMLADAFARELVSQALTTPAPRVIRLGTGADTLPMLAEMPGEQRDALLSANYLLDTLP